MITQRGKFWLVGWEPPREYRYTADVWNYLVPIYQWIDENLSEETNTEIIRRGPNYGYPETWFAIATTNFADATLLHMTYG